MKNSAKISAFLIFSLVTACGQAAKSVVKSGSVNTTDVASSQPQKILLPFVKCETDGITKLHLNLEMSPNRSYMKVVTASYPDSALSIEAHVASGDVYGSTTGFLNTSGRLTGSFEGAPQGVLTQISIFRASDELELVYLETGEESRGGSPTNMRIKKLENCVFSVEALGALGLTVDRTPAGN